MGLNTLIVCVGWSRINAHFVILSVVVSKYLSFRQILYLTTETLCLKKKRKKLLSFLFVCNNFTLSEFFRIFVFWANLEDEWNTCYTLSGFKGWIEYMLYFVWTYCLIFHNFCLLDKYRWLTKNQVDGGWPCFASHAKHQC